MPRIDQAEDLNVLVSSIEKGMLFSNPFNLKPVLLKRLQRSQI
jgi:hypothetical protein